MKKSIDHGLIRRLRESVLYLATNREPLKRALLRVYCRNLRSLRVNDFPKNDQEKYEWIQNLIEDYLNKAKKSSDYVDNYKLELAFSLMNASSKKKMARYICELFESVIKFYYGDNSIYES